MANDNNGGNGCCCCELATDLTLAAWESWSGCLTPEATPDQAAETIAAMYAKIHPVVAGQCTCECGCRPEE